MVGKEGLEDKVEAQTEWGLQSNPHGKEGKECRMEWSCPMTTTHMRKAKGSARMRLMPE